MPLFTGTTPNEVRVQLSLSQSLNICVVVVGGEVELTEVLDFTSCLLRT